MFREGILSNRRYSKCAGVVGEVLKKYHPHGDSAVYDSLVRMAPNWNMRVPLIDGRGTLDLSMETQLHIVIQNVA